MDKTWITMFLRQNKGLKSGINQVHEPQNQFVSKNNKEGCGISFVKLKRAHGA